MNNGITTLHPITIFVSFIRIIEPQQLAVGYQKYFIESIDRMDEIKKTRIIELHIIQWEIVSLLKTTTKKM